MQRSVLRKLPPRVYSSERRISKLAEKTKLMATSKRDRRPNLLIYVAWIILSAKVFDGDGLKLSHAYSIENRQDKGPINVDEFDASNTFEIER